MMVDRQAGELVEVFKETDSDTSDDDRGDADWRPTKRACGVILTITKLRIESKREYVTSGHKSRGKRQIQGKGPSRKGREQNVPDRNEELAVIGEQAPQEAVEGEKKLRLY